MNTAICVVGSRSLEEQWRREDRRLPMTRVSVQHGDLLAAGDICRPGRVIGGTDGALPAADVDTAHAIEDCESSENAGSKRSDFASYCTVLAASQQEFRD